MKCDEGGFIYSVVPPISHQLMNILTMTNIAKYNDSLPGSKNSNFTEHSQIMRIHEQYFTVLPIRCHMNSKDSDS